jgi:hypothetical protein
MCQKVVGASRFLFGCAAFVFSILTLTLAASSLPTEIPGLSIRQERLAGSQPNPTIPTCRIFGDSDIEDGEVEVGEGQTLPATVVFPNDPSKQIGIAWKDSTNKRNPDRVQLSERKVGGGLRMA